MVENETRIKKCNIPTRPVYKRRHFIRNYSQRLQHPQQENRSLCIDQGVQEVLCDLHDASTMDSEIQKETYFFGNCLCDFLTRYFTQVGSF